MAPLRKWTIVVVVTSASFCVTSCSSMIPFTYPAVEREFNVGSEVATLGLSLFVLGLGFFPLVLGPLSEFYGRSPVYFVGFGLFLAFNFGCAFAHNIATLLVCRFLAGAAGSAFLSVAGGTIADIFRPHEVGAPMGVYTAGPFRECLTLPRVVERRALRKRLKLTSASLVGSRTCLRTAHLGLHQPEYQLEMDMVHTHHVSSQMTGVSKRA